MLQALDKISTKILRVIPFILGFLVPLFYLPFTVDYFAFNKYLLVAVIGTISLLAWCLRNIARGKLHFTTSPALLPLVILVIANIVSSIWLSPTKHLSLFGQTSLFFFMAITFISVTSSQKNRFTVSYAIIGLISSASLLSLFTLFHYFGLTKQIFSSADFTSRYFNPTGNVLTAITYTLPILIATTFYSANVKNWVQRSLLFASMLLMITASIINLTIILPQNGTTIVSILPFRAGWSIAVDTMKTWQTALLGTGPETYLTAFTRLRPSFLNYSADFWTIRFSESSNFIFTLITTTGLIGSLAFIFAFLRPLFTALKNKKTVEEKSSFNFLTVALLATAVDLLVVPNGIVTLVLGLVLLIALTIEFKINNFRSTKDITLSLSANTPAAPTYHDLPETVMSTTATSSFLPWLVTFLAVILLSLYWVFAGKMFAASVSYKQATVLSQNNPYDSFAKYQKAAALDPYNPYYEQKLSQIYLAVSNAYFTKKDATADDKTAGSTFAQRALDAGKLAVQLDPYNVTGWENLFSTYRSLISYAEGAADMALSHGMQAISLDPTNPTLYIQLANLLYNLGDANQSVRYTEKAIDLKGDWNLPYINLSSIYKAQKNYALALQYAQAGQKYTDNKSEDYQTIQNEITALQKMIPAQSQDQTGSPSAAIK